MTDLVALLGALALVLTFSAMFRVSSKILGGGAVLPGVTALAAAVSFILVFEYLILVLGLLVFATPIAITYRYQHRLPAVQGVSTTLRRFLPARLRPGGQICEDCGESNKQSDQYCDNCGNKLNS